jgi:hypothetical protein
MIYVVRKDRHIECPALQLTYNIARESRVCRERIVNVSELKMVRQNLELVMTQQKVVHLGHCVDDSEIFLLWYCPS